MPLLLSLLSRRRPYGSTPQPCGYFRVRAALPPKERPEPDGLPRERVRAALLAVDDADRRVHDEARLAQRLDRLEQGAAGGDDVLDEADALALLVRALDPFRGAVLLRRLAHDEERQAGLERRRRRERDGAELGPGEARRVRSVLAHGRRDALAERAQQLGPRLEAVLVEVVAGALAGAQEEVALEICVLDERRGERSVAFTGARRRATSRARRAASFSASGEPSTNETIEPSSK